MRMIRKGEYDLVNISLIGFDPNTGKSYDECYDEWKAELDRVTTELAALRWWQVFRRLRLGWQVACLDAKLGMP